MPLYGIEQEIPLLRDEQSEFVDFSNTGFEELESIVSNLPEYPDDYPKLRVGDLGIKRKRWYVEGYERFNEDGSYIATLPKSLEIRTVPHDSAESAIELLKASYRLLRLPLHNAGFHPVWLSFNPFLKEFIPNPSLNSYEKKMRSGSPELASANIAQLSFGPDISISFSKVDGFEMTDKKLVDIGKKLTYYSPGIIPFSFSSPFYGGELWKGLSVRSFLRTGRRPAVMVFLYDDKNMIVSNPSLTQQARIPFERGRIEFKAFDTCNDPQMYLSLITLIEGLIMDEALPGRALVPDESLHKMSAQYDFTDDRIIKLGHDALISAQKALPPIKSRLLDPLFEMIQDRSKLPGNKIVNTYKKNNSIIKTLAKYENLNL
jgi:hypothetical protein